MKTVTGNPIVISDGNGKNANELSVSFTPKQNLNGFDHPWGPWCVKNLVGREVLTWSRSIDASGDVVSYSANRCATVDTIPIDNSKSYVFSTVSSDINLLYAVYNGSTLVRRVSAVVSGTVINVTGGDSIRLCFYSYDGTRPSGQQFDYREVSPEDDQIQVEQASTATTYEKFANICSITSDRDSITVLKSDENLLGAMPDQTVISNGVTFETHGQKIVGTRTAAGSAQAFRYVDVPNTVEPGDYYFIGKTKYESNYSDAFVWDLTTGARAKKWDGTTQVDADYGDHFGTPYEVKIESGHTYLFNLRVYTSAPFGEYEFFPMLLKPDKTGNVSVAFSAPQCSGVLNFKTGELTVDKIKIPVSDATKKSDTNNGWATGTNANRIGFAIDPAILPRQEGSLDLLCNIGYASADTNSSDGSAFSAGACSLYRGTACMYFRYCVPKSITSVADAYAYLKKFGCEFTVPLDTPLTYQLTAQQLALLVGVNTIATNGDVILLIYGDSEEIVGIDTEIIYLLACLSGDEDFDSDFVVKSRVGDLLYSYLAGTTPTIYTDPVESRVEHLMKYWLGFESKSSYISLPPRSRVEAILSSKIEGTSYTGETLSDVEKLLIRITI